MLLVSQLEAQNTNPVVSNVRYTPINSDGIVDIYYDVTDSEQNFVTISVQVSNDNGSTFDYWIFSVSGDIGPGVAVGYEKHIVWNFIADQNYYTNYDSFVFRIIANDETEGGSSCPGTPIVEYGNKIYNTVLIGDQCWLKENIDIGTRVDGENEQLNNGIIEKFCFNNNDANCAVYGGLYEWAEAVQYQNGATNNLPPSPAFSNHVRGICPFGWHVPSLDELFYLKKLVKTNEAFLNKNQSVNATNTSGFSVLLSGLRHSNLTFRYMNISGYFWTSTNNINNYTAYLLTLDENTPNYNGNYLHTDYKIDGLGVRCLKD
ncbi:MAG: FISUMP domain-containing protein [bacterium]